MRGDTNYSSKASSAVKQAAQEPRAPASSPSKSAVAASYERRLNSDEYLSTHDAQEMQKVIDSGGTYKPRF